MNDLIVDDPNFDIRYTRITDITYLKSWLIDPRVLEWFSYEYDQAEEIERFAKYWISFCKYKASLTATFRSHPIGIVTIYLLPYKKVSHMGWLQIVVDPIWQGQGVGTSLIKNIKHHAKTHFNLESLHIDVIEGSKIMSILKKSGFYEVSRQEGYYKVDGIYKARIVMEVSLL